MKLLSRLRAHKVVRYAALGLTIAVAILVGAAVATVTIELGPRVRELGERQASKQLKRDVRIGRLSIHLLRGRVVVEDFSIAGLAPADRPFFTAKRLSIGLDWSTALRRRPEFTLTSVEMSDWTMLVEKWEDRHNFPKFTSDEPEAPGPKRFTTTLRYLRARGGQFSYEDHESPWSIVAPNIDLNITNVPDYHGTATFAHGTVKIQNYLPMSADMKADFALDGSRVRLDRIQFHTDGAETRASGEVDFSRWPEQSYQVRSKVNFPRMRDIFFHDETWSLAGEGDFSGTFHLFKGGHDLSGTFSSPLFGVNAYRFPSLFGSLGWTSQRFDVWNAGARLYGGDARFTYSIGHGEPNKPRPARFDVNLSNVDVAAVSDIEALSGVRFAGGGSGHLLIEWPLGHFSQHRGNGHLVVTPSGGSFASGQSSDVAERVDAGQAGRERRPLAPPPLPAHVPIAGDLAFEFDEGGVEVGPSRFESDRTHVTFQGSTAWGGQSRFAFHVASRDWQESDELLAGIITDFGSHASPVAIGGRGEFDGVMSGPFRRPRVEGRFTASDLRAFDTLWGSGGGSVVIENNYVTVTGGSVKLADDEIHADGLFSLGYPRDDGDQEIDARFRLVRRDLNSLRHAFKIDQYPVTGRLSGEFHLTGAYESPTGFGGMTIDEGVAYGEPFQKAAASLRFDGTGVRLDGLTIDKGGGAVTGAAYVGWNGTYSFNADGQRIPMDRIAAFQYPRAPLSGTAQFSAAGSATFDTPSYDVRFRVNDLSVAEESVGQVTGSLALRGQQLSGDIDAASPRLAVTGTGRIALTPKADAELAFRFHDSSLDPYVRLFEPRLSPYTTAVASGSIRVAGELGDLHHLSVDATVDALDVRLFDYALKNAGPIRIALDQDEITLRNLEIVGDDTRLRLTGRVGLRDQQIAVQAGGAANLGILQAFFRNVRGSGRAELAASVDGPLRRPVFSGSATIAGGRIRHLALPNSLDGINGVIRFDPRGIRLDDLNARMGEGPVQFGGRIGFEGYMPGDLNVIVRGQDMHLRYPEGIRSTVDADLSVRGNFRAPAIGGTVTVKSALWTRRLDAPGNIFDLATSSSTSSPSASSPSGAPSAAPVSTIGGVPAEPPQAVPIRFDVQIVAPSTLRIDTNLVKLVANADLTLRGTYDRPVLFGHADIQRGEVSFEGRRYRVTRGAIDFTNPNRIEPFFDVEAETNVRVPGQTYRVTVSGAGTAQRFNPKVESDPPLPTADVLALLLSDVQRTSPRQDVAPELRALQNPNQTQSDILKARATQALTSPISSEVGKVVEQTFGVDTFQLTPSFVDPYRTSRVNPTARLTIGKRISDRAYLTFSRSLNTTFNDQIILLEYDASDRLFWLLSRNEDQQTYALEFRVRHAF